MKLVFEIHWCEEYVASGTHTVPFEYSSKEDFQYMVLEKIKEYKELCIKKYGKKDGSLYYLNGYITILGKDYNIENLEGSIDYIYELNEWFERNKI